MSDKLQFVVDSAKKDRAITKADDKLKFVGQEGMR
jgi:hypothetical protein